MIYFFNIIQLIYKRRTDDGDDDDNADADADDDDDNTPNAIMADHSVGA